MSFDAVITPIIDHHIIEEMEHTDFISDTNNEKVSQTATTTNLIGASVVLPHAHDSSDDESDNDDDQYPWRNQKLKAKVINDKTNELRTFDIKTIPSNVLNSNDPSNLIEMTTNNSASLEPLLTSFPSTSKALNSSLICPKNIPKHKPNAIWSKITKESFLDTAITCQMNMYQAHRQIESYPYQQRSAVVLLKPTLDNNAASHRAKKSRGKRYHQQHGKLTVFEPRDEISSVDDTICVKEQSNKPGQEIEEDKAEDGELLEKGNERQEKMGEDEVDSECGSEEFSVYNNLDPRDVALPADVEGVETPFPYSSDASNSNVCDGQLSSASSFNVLPEITCPPLADEEGTSASQQLCSSSTLKRKGDTSVPSHRDIIQYYDLCSSNTVDDVDEDDSLCPSLYETSHDMEFKHRKLQPVASANIEISTWRVTPARDKLLQRLPDAKIPMTYGEIEEDGCLTFDEVINIICDKLHENKVELISCCVNNLGLRKSLEFLFLTEDIQYNGGLLTCDLHRKRTPGGVFMQVIKQSNDIDPQRKKNILNFDHNKSEIYAANKKAKKIKRRKEKVAMKHRNENVIDNEHNTYDNNHAEMMQDNNVDLPVVVITNDNI